jgi:hypothetical protein
MMTETGRANQMDANRQSALDILDQTIGIPIEILSNDFEEFAGNTHHKIVFQIQLDDPDIFAIGVLFALSLMSFTFSGPRGYSEVEFIPDEEWNLGYFVNGLKFENRCICFSADYVSGRHMKTDIVFETGGKVTLSTRNRGKGADRWLTHLQGNLHIIEA